MEDGDIARRSLLAAGALGVILVVDKRFEEWKESWDDASDEYKDEDVMPLITFPQFPGMNQGGDELDDDDDDDDDDDGSGLIKGVGSVVGGTVSAVTTVAPIVWKGVEFGVNDVVLPTAKFTKDVVAPEAKKAADVLIPEAQRLAQDTSTVLKPLIQEAVKEATPIIEPVVESAKQEIASTLDTVVRPAVSTAGANLDSAVRPTLEAAQKVVSEGVSSASSSASEIQRDAIEIAGATKDAVAPAIPVLQVAGGAAAEVAKGTFSVASSAVESFQEGGGAEVVKDAIVSTAETTTPVVKQAWSFALEWAPPITAKAQAVAGEVWGWAQAKLPVFWEQVRSKASTPSEGWKPPSI